MDSNNNREENLKKIEAFTKKASNLGANLAVFPETADYIGTDYAKNSWALEQAKAYFSKLAKTYNLYLHCGSITESTADKPYNTTLFFAPDGNCIADYRKLHMFDIQVTDGVSYKESDSISKGNKISIIKTPLATIGFAICYDIRFPELFRLMAAGGAEIFCICANFTMPTGKDHWETLLRARAIENGCYVIAANQIGIKPNFQAYGNSMVIDPWGTVIARCSNREEIITADIDLDYLHQIRAQLPSLYNLREDIYQLHGETFTKE